MIVLALLLTFTLLGYSWTSGARSGLLLAPTVGLASTVLLSYFLSANFKLAGADAVAVAIPLIFLVTFAREWKFKKTFKQRYAFFYNDLRSLLLSLIPAIILLIPALVVGVNVFFGYGNFDFFFNSQDGWFLASHNVNDFAIEADDHVLPLTWSANAQGRFAVTLLTSFAYKYFEFNVLHFNAALLTSCVLMAALVSFALAKHVLGLSSKWSLLASCFFIMSAGFSQGYSYFLLGQLSAIPLFLATMFSLKPILDSWGNDNSNGLHKFWKNGITLAFWLNALYVFYTILAFFACALFILAALLNARSKRAFKGFFTFSSKLLGLVLVLFLLIRFLSLEAATHAIVQWVELSFRTAGVGTKGPQVFTEYLTEGFLALLIGAVRYPSIQSIFGPVLWFRGSQSIPLLILSLLSIASFLLSCRYFFTNRHTSVSGRAIFAALLIVSLTCGLAFFISGSGYAIFKIGSWFIPICLMMPVGALASILHYKSSTFDRRALVFASTTILGLNVVSAFNYLYPFLPLSTLFGYQQNAQVVDLKDIEKLKTLLPSNGQLHLDFLDGIKAAWFANEFRDRNVYAYSHNLQPLADRQVEGSICPTKNINVREHELLISDHVIGGREDIISMNPSPRFSYVAGKYHVINMEDLDFYVSLGRGTYPSYQLSKEEIKNTGLPPTLRWVEKGFELYIFAREPGMVKISFDAAPGFVLGPDVRSLKLNFGDMGKTVTFSKSNQHILFENLKVNSGINCMFIESPDAVKNIKRYGALFRDEVTLDSRFLNYAIGNLKADYQH